MKMKNALAVAAIGTLAAGSLAPAQTIMPDAQVGYAIGSLGTKLGWWPAYAGYAEAVTSTMGGLMGASGGKIGAAVGTAGGPVGMMIGAAVGAL